MDVTLTVRVASEDYVAAIEVIYWTYSKIFGKFESFTHQKIEIRPRFTWLNLALYTIWAMETKLIFSSGKDHIKLIKRQMLV